MSEELEIRSVQAMKNFPLPNQNSTSSENYRRILNWLYSNGEFSPANLVIDLAMEEKKS